MAKTITLPEKPKGIKLPRIARELVQCQMCGYCIDVCEAHRMTPWESVTARGKIYYLNQLDKAGLGLVDKVLGRGAKISPEFVDAVYKCTGCGNCEEICHAKIELVKLWEIVRTWLVQQGVAPLPVHKGIAKKIMATGNSFGEPASKRDAWWPAGVPRAEVPDVIFFAGCTGSYRMQHIPAAGATILSRAGVKMNCLGEDEICCTSPLLRTGIRDLTLEAGRTIITKADAMGAKDMVMTCSGCYKTVSSNLGEYYSKPGQNVYHFTQYVDKLIKEKKLVFNNEYNAKVTYHDPCHLGRHSGVYEEPRNILKKIKGLDFVEMEKNRDNSRCCGAGGGYKSAFNDFAVTIAAERIHDAEAVGAEVIATACPFCVLNLKAGAKKAGSPIKVMDISEILLHVTGPKIEPPAPVEEVPAIDPKEIDDLKAKVAEAEKKAADAAAEAEAAKKQAADAEAAAKEKAGDMDILKARIATSEAAAEKAKQQADEAKTAAEDVEALKAKVAEAEKKAADAETATAEAKKQADEAKTAAAEAEKRAAEAEAKAAEAQQKNDALMEEYDFEDFEEDIPMEEMEFDWDTSPEGAVRRAAWNKNLRCRRGYGPFAIPVAFVKAKVAVYVGGNAEEHRAELEKNGWVVLSYKEEEITDGQAQAEEIRTNVKAQLRTKKKPRKKKKA